MAQFNNGFQPYTPVGTPGNIQSGTSDVQGIPIQGVRLVSSIEEVKGSSVPFGMRSMFMNIDDPLIYIKDYNGNTRMFEFKEKPLPTPEDFVTKQEFEELRRKYESLVQQQPATANQQQPIQQPQSYANNAGNAELSGNAGASQGTVLPTNTTNGMGSGANQSVPI